VTSNMLSFLPTTWAHVSPPHVQITLHEGETKVRELRVVFFFSITVQLQRACCMQVHPGLVSLLCGKRCEANSS
jgi:hypothetical protein